MRVMGRSNHPTAEINGFSWRLNQQTIELETSDDDEMIAVVDYKEVVDEKTISIPHP
jgi:hypothetical protein